MSDQTPTPTPGVASTTAANVQPTGTTDPQPNAAAAASPPATPDPAQPTGLAAVPADQLDPERLRATVLAQREEEAKLRAQLADAKKAQDELAAIKQAQETDAQRIQRERDEAVAKADTAQQALQMGFLLAELAKPEHGLVDAEAAAALITGVQYGDDGRPTNAAERIQALVEAKGYLKTQPVAPAVPTAPQTNAGAGTGGALPPQLTPEEVEHCRKIGKTPEEYARWKNVRTPADVQAATSST